METTMLQDTSGISEYQQKLDRVRKYTVSQGIPLDSPRARKYALSQGVEPSDLGVEIVDSLGDPNDARDTVRNYAKSVGLETNDPSVRAYTSSGAENEPIDQVDIDSEHDNERFKEAVLHYAESQHLSVDDMRVQKYARGLLKPTGDFSTEKQAEKLDKEVIERRIGASVQRYADSMGLAVDDPRVIKYEQGQRKGPYRALLQQAQ